MRSGRVFWGAVVKVMAARKSLEELRSEIVEAFSDVPYPGDEQLVGHRCRDCSPIATLFKGKRWQDFIDKPMELVGEYRALFAVMTPAAFQYYLPLALSAVSGWPVEADTLTGSLIFHMTPSRHGDAKDLAEERVSRLTVSQIAAVIATFEFLKQGHGSRLHSGQIEQAIFELLQWLGANRKRSLGGASAVPASERIKLQVRAAFAHVEFPGDWCLSGSTEGTEPAEVKEEFKGKCDRDALGADFLDQAPKGHATALSFFSDEAFHFYLPAYLIADLDGKLERADPAFHLIHGLDAASKDERVNPRRYGERTWFEAARYKFAMFTQDESAAIASYLKWKAQHVEFGWEKIEQALANYWNNRTSKTEGSEN